MPWRRSSTRIAQVKKKPGTARFYFTSCKARLCLASDHILQAFQGSNLDGLRCGLGFKHHLFAGKGVYALPCLRRRFLDHAHFQEAGHGEQSAAVTAAKTLFDL